MLVLMGPCKHFSVDVCELQQAYPDFVDIIGVVDRLTEVAVPGCSRAY